MSEGSGPRGDPGASLQHEWESAKDKLPRRRYSENGGSVELKAPRAPSCSVLNFHAILGNML